MSIPGYRIKIRLKLLEEQLGTGSSNPDIHREYIASKAPDAASIEEEVAAHGVDEVEKKDMTVFPKDESGNPFMWNYQLNQMGWHIRFWCFIMEQANVRITR